MTNGATTANDDSKPNPPLQGVAAKDNADGAALGVAMNAIKTFDQVLVGNDAIIYGYPVSLGLPRQPQFETDRPLLRKALIAGEDSQKRKIILDGPTIPATAAGRSFSSSATARARISI